MTKGMSTRRCIVESFPRFRATSEIHEARLPRGTGSVPAQRIARIDQRLGPLCCLCVGLAVLLCINWQALRSLRPASAASGSKPEVGRRSDASPAGFGLPEPVLRAEAKIEAELYGPVGWPSIVG